MIERGQATSAVEVRHGDFLRTDVTNTFEDVFARGFDFIVCLTVAVLAVPNASDGNTLGPSHVNGVAVDPQIGWCLTYLANFTGHPAISVPPGSTGACPSDCRSSDVGGRTSPSSTRHGHWNCTARGPTDTRQPAGDILRNKRRSVEGQKGTK